MNATETKARRRVQFDERLKPYHDTIFYDWPNWDEHLEWIANAPLTEIISWLESVEGKSLPALALRSIKSEKRSAASRENGRKGGRPRQPQPPRAAE